MGEMRNDNNTLIDLAKRGDLGALDFAGLVSTAILTGIGTFLLKLYTESPALLFELRDQIQEHNFQGLIDVLVENPLTPEALLLGAGVSVIAAFAYSLFMGLIRNHQLNQ